MFPHCKGKRKKIPCATAKTEHSQINIFFKRCRRTCPRSSGREPRHWRSEYLKAPPDLTDSWNPQTYIHIWVQIIPCLATVHSPLQEDQPIELPGPGDRGTWALKVGNPEKQSSPPPLRLLSRCLSEKLKVGDKLIYLS